MARASNGGQRRALPRAVWPRGPPWLGTRRESSFSGSALAWRSLSPAVNGRGPDASPAEACAATLCRRAQNPRAAVEPSFWGAEPAPATAAPSCPCSLDARDARPTPYEAAPATAHLRRASPIAEKHHADPPRAARLRTSGNRGRLRRRLEHGRETSRFWSRLPRAIIEVVGQWVQRLR